MADKEKDKTRVVTPRFRMSFPKLWKAEGYKDQEPKFSITMLFGPKDDISSLKKAVFAAKVAEYGPDKTKWPKLRSPFNDGNEKADLDGYKNTIYVVAKNKHKPQVVDRELQPVTEEDDIVYAGCYCRAAIRAFCYGGGKTGFKPGVSFSLESVKFVKDGPRFSGAMAAADAFAGVDDEDADEDDEGSYGEDDDSEEDGGF